MRFPLTQALLDEANRFSLRSACRHCRFFLAREQRCGNDWPDEGQSRWPLDAVRPDDPPGGPTEAQFCKEFELA